MNVLLPISHQFNLSIDLKYKVTGRFGWWKKTNQTCLTFWSDERAILTKREYHEGGKKKKCGWKSNKTELKSPTVKNSDQEKRIKQNWKEKGGLWARGKKESLFLWLDVTSH